MPLCVRVRSHCVRLSAVLVRSALGNRGPPVPAKNPIRPTIDLDRTCNILSRWISTAVLAENPIGAAIDLNGRLLTTWRRT